ncbi:hypothetical protein CVT26_002104 [Gymnopilus dilepis]|uniref:Hyaluronan/mRNA-binding protein domain-containing protein n=1 Tax=Gymnopilus dilepis TaxID=231916 RepID=A0A409VEV7_9AGAR|nr:hypothetical protein CVT26_002104 [Gymnopilus dilepis]
MSVATKNPFALLDDDDAGSAPEVVTKQEPTPAPAQAPRSATAQKTRGGGPASRGGKYYARGGKPAAKDTAPVTEESAETQKKFEGGERGRGRGGRGGRGGPRGRGRQFDRHSQTGKTDSEKKIHQSWGGDDGNSELKTEQAAAIDATAEATTNDWSGEAAAAAADWGAAPAASADAWGAAPEDAAAAPAAEGEAKEGRPRREREPEEDDNTLTLDQYLAQQKEKEAAVPKIEGTRAANDGADDVFKDAVPLSKNADEDAYFVGKTKNAPKARSTKKEEKVYIEIDARFERPDRGGRGRGRGGDRGGDRGDRRGGPRGGRGGPRGGAARQNGGAPTTVDVDDQTAFPSLS